MTLPQRQWVKLTQPDFKRGDVAAIAPRHSDKFVLLISCDILLVARCLPSSLLLGDLTAGFTADH